MNGQAASGLSIGIAGEIVPGVMNYFFQRIWEAEHETCKHVHVFTDKDSAINERSNEDVLVPSCRKSIRNLSAKGADVILLASMIMHGHFDKIIRFLPAPERAKMVNLVELAVDSLQNSYPEGTVFGVMCHGRVWERGTFQKAFRDRGLALVDASRSRDLILSSTSIAVDALRAPERNLELARSSIRAAAGSLRRAGAEVILLGSVTLPLAMPVEGISIPLVDPLTVAANELVHRPAGASLASVSL